MPKEEVDEYPKSALDAIDGGGGNESNGVASRGEVFLDICGLPFIASLSSFTEEILINRRRLRGGEVEEIRVTASLQLPPHRSTNVVEFSECKTNFYRQPSSVLETNEIHLYDPYPMEAAESNTLPPQNRRLSK